MKLQLAAPLLVGTVSGLRPSGAESVFRKTWKVVNKVCNLCALMEVIQPGGKVPVSSGCLAGCMHCIGCLRPVLGGKWMHSHKTSLVS